MRENLTGANLKEAQGTEALPIAEPAQDTKLFVFPKHGQPGTWVMHHAAHFAAVRWTNVFDPATMIYRGDLIGGPLRPHFGSAILDIDLRRLRGQAQWFSYTRYWSSSAAPEVLKAVREAVDLLDKD